MSASARRQGVGGSGRIGDVQPGKTKESPMSIPQMLAASTVDAYAVTSERLVATAAALTALAGAVTGGFALARRTGRGGHHTGKRGPTVALVAGVTGLVVGGLVVATADGGPGTGNGVVGGYAAVVLGLIAAVLGGLVLARSRRTVS
jgi:hypothetical protein